MGQQQLLLLVLSTVIVGLATVAGIQAFSENQRQATQDALVQRAISIGNDVLAVHNEPSQFGGVNLTGTSSADATELAKAAGYSSDTSIPADGAGENASCSITTSSDKATVKCGSNGPSSDGLRAHVLIQPNVTADDSSKVSTAWIGEAAS